MASPTSSQPTERLLGLLDAFARMTHQALLSGPERTEALNAARAFLERLGFEPDRFHAIPVGFFADCATLRRRLEEAGYSAEEIEASELVADSRLDGRLVGPIRDPEGCIRSFWARHPSDTRPPYLFKGRWKEELGAVGLEVAYPAVRLGRAPLVLVEALFDALLIQSLGFPNIAAIGGSAAHMSRERWQRLALWGVRRVMLVPSATESGHRDARVALKNAARAQPAPQVALVAPARLGRYRTAGDLVRGAGLGAFRAILEPLGPDPPTPQRTPPPPPQQRPRRGYCSLHQCDETDCFCFD